MNQSIATRLEDPTEPLAVKPLGAAQALQSEAQTTALPRDFLIEAPMRPDPIDTRRHTSGAPPPRAVGDWLAAA
ncbi:MAG: hypothetical protein ABIT61_09010, partial [Steroidobacteraceae bacterium]